MHKVGLTQRQAASKRLFDVAVAVIGLVSSLPVLSVAWVVASIETRGNGLFRQVRIGRDGRPFRIMKLRTMREVAGVGTTVTTSHDMRITKSGKLMRKFKIDELPQLINVIIGEMSLVGPRPDVPGFADQLVLEDRIVLSVRPGITGPAALAYRHEERLLATAAEPERFNREVIWPDKVRISRGYVENYSFGSDLRCLVQTVLCVVKRADPDEEKVH